MNKFAVITGGTSGIGLATAKAFIAAGAKVIITGRNSQTIDETVAQLGPGAYGIVSDASSMAVIDGPRAVASMASPREGSWPRGEDALILPPLQHRDRLSHAAWPGRNYPA